MTADLHQRLDAFVASTREAVFVREADQVLMIRPDKTLGINRTAASILGALYDRQRRPAAVVLEELVHRLRVDPARLERDALQLIENLSRVLNEDFAPGPGLRLGSFQRSRVRFPTLAEIALTYGCQNRCSFCYAGDPGARRAAPMSTAQVQRVMDKVFYQAHVPSLSFTGGESTLRPDLPDLIRHGVELGLRINLISNGLRAAELSYAGELVEAGLASTQISLEAAEASLHDRIVGHPGAHAATVAGVRNFKSLGIHVHTNTTLCRDNLERAGELVRFVARNLELPTLSLNMVIRTGAALSEQRTGLAYHEVGERLPRLLEVARQEGVRLVWYSPIPYCIFNPVLHGLGAKSCACVHGILSVDPTGQVLPCSSFETGLGSLLEQDFATIYSSRRATYWRRRQFLPPICRGCPDADLCAGACPLYWDAAGSFTEIPRPGADAPRVHRRWMRGRSRSGSFGVEPPRRQADLLVAP